MSSKLEVGVNLKLIVQIYSRIDLVSLYSKMLNINCNFLHFIQNFGIGIAFTKSCFNVIESNTLYSIENSQYPSSVLHNHENINILLLIIVLECNVWVFDRLDGSVCFATIFKKTLIRDLDLPRSEVVSCSIQNCLGYSNSMRKVQQRS